MDKTNQKTRQVGNGEGSLYKSNTLNRLVFQYYVGGKRKTIKQKKNEGITEFKARVTKIKNELNTGTYIEKSKDTAYGIAKEYIEQKYKDGITSPRSYRRDLGLLVELEITCENFIHKPIQKVVVKDIQNAKEKIREYSDSVIDKIWAILKRTFKIAVSRRLIVFNIMEDETLIKPKSKKAITHVEALTQKEERKLIDLLNNSNHKYKNIILLQLYTGMRVGEVLALSVDCIDLKNNSITVYRTLTRDDNDKTILGSNTKTYDKFKGIDKGKRTFPMTKQVREIILNVLSSKMQNINNLLFWDYNKNNFCTPSQVNCYLKRLNEKEKITDNLHNHKLRHTFVTRCSEKGMPLKVIQSLVGHVDGSSITTDVYTSVSYDFMKQELEKLV